MKTGFNSDVVIKGESYHIQSEDRGGGNPCLVSQIFKSGAIIKTVKTSYKGNSQKEINESLKKQHSEVLKKLIAGTL